MAFVIKRNEDGKYVAPAGRAKSYTARLESARVFATREAAERDKCGNERVVAVADLIGHPGE